MADNKDDGEFNMLGFMFGEGADYLDQARIELAQVWFAATRGSHRRRALKADAKWYFVDFLAGRSRTSGQSCTHRGTRQHTGTPTARRLPSHHLTSTTHVHLILTLLCGAG
jgi:hypothetical protein